MKKYLFLILFPFCLLANEGKVIFTKGTVELLKGEKIKKGDSLSLGQTIKTGEDALAVIQLPQGNKVKVGPSSELKITALPKTNSDQTVLSLLKGNSFIKVLKIEIYFPSCIEKT